MLRRMILGGLVALAVVGVATSAYAEVSVNFGINLPAPPQLVVVPGTPVFFGGPGYFQPAPAPPPVVVVNPPPPPPVVVYEYSYPAPQVYQYQYYAAPPAWCPPGLAKKGRC